MQRFVYTSERRALLWSGLALLLLCSCAAERTCGPGKGPTAIEYYPLAVGNNWTYYRGSSADSFWIDTTWIHADTTFFVKSGRSIGGAWYFNTY
jgi:hypothetical protein